MNVILVAIWLGVAALVGLMPGRALAGLRAADLVNTELLAEPDAIEPGQPFSLAVRLTAKPGWHTYWINPGDSGLPTEVNWTLPPGFEAGPIQWPTPERIPVNDLMNYGYGGAVMLLSTVTPPRGLAADEPVAIAAQVHYLVCREECIPGTVRLTTSLPVSPAGSASTAGHRGAFDEARARLPQGGAHPVKTDIAAGTASLWIEDPSLGGGAVTGAYFFPFDDAAIDHAAPQVLAAKADGFTLSMKRASGPDAKAPVLDGVLTIATDGRTEAWQIGQPAIPPSAASANAGEAATASPTAHAEPLTAMTVVWAACLAFLGGILLNLMPCVFPVLSIKALALVRYGGHSPGRAKAHGLAYGFGVVATFVALAAILLAARAGGSAVGWGFQLQSPLFVAILAAILFAMGLSFSGVASFGGRLAALAGGAPERAGLVGSALTGALATLVATPCTAPFMGAAVGLAMTAAAPVAMAIFVALGLGMAAPFVALTFWPGLIGRLPRPGGWMETLKQFLAFPLYATAAWLVFVLAQEVGPTGLFAALIGLVLVAFALWALRLGRMSEGRGRVASRGALALAILALALVGVTIDRDRATTPRLDEAGDGIEPFTQARLDGLRATGRPVFVDMTAAWCITCLVNERTALASDAVRTRMKAGNVAYLRGDWTRQNPEITRLLERHGRSGVPLYLVYPAKGDAIVLPQILTQSAVLDGIERASAEGGSSTRRAAAEPAILQ